MSPGVTSGSAVNVIVLAETANNHVALGYSGTADVTSSDGSASLPGPVTFSHGVAKFQLTFASLGAQSVSVTDEASNTVTGTGSTNVAAPAVVTHFAVYMAPGATDGKPVSVEVVAEDAENHIVPSFAGTATITSSDGSATLPAPVTLQNGHAKFQVTFNTAGLQSVTATDDVDGTVTGTASANVLAPIEATHFVVSLPQGVAAGSPFNVGLVAEDASNHIVTGYNGTVSLSSSDGAATLPAAVTFVNGHATVQVTMSTTGQQSLTATDTTNSSLTGTGNTNVAIAHYVIRLASGVTAGKEVTVQLTATDDQNHILTNYTGTANLSTTDAGATLPATVTFQDGRASFKVTFATPGQQTLTAIDDTDASPVGAATTNVAVQAVATHYVVLLPQGTTAGVAVHGVIVAEDAQNRIVKDYSATAELASSDSTATLPASVIFSHGYATFTATFNTAGLQQVTATDSADSSLVGMASTNVAAAAAATHFVVLMQPGAIAGSPTLAIVVAADAENHIVPNYSGSVNISSTDSGATLPASLTFSHGYATFKATFATAGQQTVSATDSVDGTLTGSATTNVIAKPSAPGGLLGRIAGLFR